MVNNFHLKTQYKFSRKSESPLDKDIRRGYIKTTENRKETTMYKKVEGQWIAIAEDCGGIK
jgi:hypothetical protein